MSAWLLIVLIAASPVGDLPAVRVGQWVTYRLEAEHRAPLAVRLAAVENLGPTAIWLELEAGPSEDLREPLLQLKLLCEREGSGLSGRILRAVAVVGHGLPREVDPRSWQLAVQGLATPVLSGASSMWGRSQAVRLAAGTIQARPWSIQVAGRRVERAWFSTQVPLLGLVRWESPAADQALQLRSYGENAEPHVALPLPKATASK